MPIRAYLFGERLDAETIRILNVAFAITRTAIEVDDRNEDAHRVIAMKLIELSKANREERNPDRLAELVLNAIDFKTLPPRTFQQQKNN